MHSGLLPHASKLQNGCTVRVTDVEGTWTMIDPQPTTKLLAFQKAGVEYVLRALGYVLIEGKWERPPKINL